LYLDVVQILQAENVSSLGVGLGDDPTEEQPEAIESCRGIRRSRMGEGKVHVYAIYAMQGQISQVTLDQFLQVLARLIDPNESEVVVLSHLEANAGVLWCRYAYFADRAS